VGNMRAHCADCGTAMHRRVRLSDLSTVMPGVEITGSQQGLRLIGCPTPSHNCDFPGEKAA
jgi:hypothetical protein